MATVTITLEAEVLEAAQHQADLRGISVEELVIDYLRSSVRICPTAEDIESLIRLIDEGPLGGIGPLPTREEIYAERTRGPG